MDKPTEDDRFLMGCISENVNVGYQLLQLATSEIELKKLPMCLERIIYQDWRTTNIFKLDIHLLYMVSTKLEPKKIITALNNDLKKYKLPNMDSDDFLTKFYKMPFNKDQQNLYGTLALQYIYSEYGI